MNESTQKITVLIDADNTSSEVISPLLDEIAKYGTISVKRIYGDWSSSKLNKWKEKLLPHAILPIQQFAYVKGKNATDMAMVIDAMDLLYSNIFDIFCIVSSDSDFTRLASRIRESGITVYGFGADHTCESFRKACDKFIYLENLVTQEKEPIVSKRKTGKQLKQDRPLIDLLSNAIKAKEDESGFAPLGQIGTYISTVKPDFDSRNYGYSKLSGLIKSIDLFEVKMSKSTMKVKLVK